MAPAPHFYNLCGKKRGAIPNLVLHYHSIKVISKGVETQTASVMVYRGAGSLLLLVGFQSVIWPWMPNWQPVYSVCVRKGLYLKTSLYKLALNGNTSALQVWLEGGLHICGGGSTYFLCKSSNNLILKCCGFAKIQVERYMQQNDHKVSKCKVFTFQVLLHYFIYIYIYIYTYIDYTHF